MVTYQDNLSDQGPSTIYVNLDAGGLGGTFGKAVGVTPTNVGQYSTIPAQPSATIDAEANLAWDRHLGSPSSGRVYLVYTDRSAPAALTADTKVFVRHADAADGYTSWSD